MPGLIPKNLVPDFDKLQAIVEEKQAVFADFLGRRYVKFEEKEYKISSLMESLKKSIEQQNSDESKFILTFMAAAKVKDPTCIKDVILKIHDYFRKNIFNQKIKDLEAQIQAKELDEKKEEVKVLEQEVQDKSAVVERIMKDLESQSTINYQQGIEKFQAQILEKQALFKQPSIRHLFPKTYNDALQMEIDGLEAALKGIQQLQTDHRKAQSDQIAKIEAEKAEIEDLTSQIKAIREQWKIAEELAPQREEQGVIREVDIAYCEAKKVEIYKQLEDMGGDSAKILKGFLEFFPLELFSAFVIKKDGGETVFDLGEKRAVALDLGSIIKREKVKKYFGEVNLKNGSKVQGLILRFEKEVKLSISKNNVLNISGLSIHSNLNLGRLKGILPIPELQAGEDLKVDSIKLDKNVKIQVSSAAGNNMITIYSWLLKPEKFLEKLESKELKQHAFMDSELSES
jgi:hypothetical protein